MSEGLLAVALGAGMLAAVNPCGFALLPAYVSLLLVNGESLSRPTAAWRAAVLSVAMSSGFAGVFALFGLVVSPVAAQLQRHLPWFTVGLGVTLTLMGLWLAAGRALSMPDLRRSGRGGSAARPLSRSFLSMAGFGATYAVASISCMIAPFLAVVVGGFRSGSVIEGVWLFLAYAAGMGLVVGTLAVATVFASPGTVGRLRGAGRWAPRAAGALLAAAGAYVAYYGWWELRVLRGSDASDPLIEAAAALQQWLAGLVQALGPIGWLMAGLVLLAAVLAVRRHSQSTAPLDRGEHMRAASRLSVAAVLALVVSGCASAPRDTPARAEPSTLTQNTDPTSGVDDAQVSDLTSALVDPAHPDFPDPLIDLDDLISGGPPPDGIRSLDRPLFEQVAEVDWLEPDEPVLSLTVSGRTKAYPIRIMMWHEIVNDRLADVPVAVTYCPLCNSGVAFERTVAGRTTTFGTSGMLYADNLVMYDRLTESLWPQLTGRASVGTLTGSELVSIPMGTVGWAQFRAEHPDATVLSRTTGMGQHYGDNPYVGYDDPDSEPMFALPSDPDARLPVKARVVGIGEGVQAVAVLRSQLAETRVQQVTVGEDRVVLWHFPGQRSALDTAEIPDGEEIGSVGAFVARVAGRPLDFVATEDGTIRDRQTDSSWNVFGRAIEGPLEGRRLEAVAHLDTFWFAWAAFQPKTSLVTEP